MRNALKKIKRLQGDNKTILLNILLSFVIKGGSLILALFTLPAYMKYFDNNTVLGVWLTILSALTWILNFDLGIGNGLRNKLVIPLVKKDTQAIKKYISSAYISLSAISLAIAIAGYFIIGLFNWNTFFGVELNYISNEVLIKVIRIVMLGILIQFVLKIVSSILYAMQISFVQNLLQLSSTILLVGFIYGGLVLGIEDASAEDNLIKMAYANIITINLPFLITTIIVFRTKLKGCLPTISLFEKKYAQDVMKIGIAFLWLQIIFMLINNTSVILIAQLVGAESVVEYQIYFRLFTLCGTLMALVLTPIWSAVTKAKAEQNYEWIKKLNNKLMVLGMCGFACQFLMIPFLQPIINLWLGENAIQVNYQYSLIFAALGGLFLWNRIISTMSNGFGELKIQMIFLTVGVVINFVLAYILSSVFKSYIAIVIANIGAFLPYCIIQPIWMHKFINKKYNENKKRNYEESAIYLVDSASR